LLLSVSLALLPYTVGLGHLVAMTLQ